MTADKIEGGCYCGAVRYRAAAAPLGSMICDCQSCRRIAAAPSVPWLTFARAALTFTRGAPAQHSSSAGVQRTFCRDCGTPLSYASEQTPDEIDITTCSLDDPNQFPPSHRSWTSHELGWWAANHELPRYARSKRDG